MKLFIPLVPVAGSPGSRKRTAGATGVAPSLCFSRWRLDLLLKLGSSSVESASPAKYVYCNLSQCCSRVRSKRHPKIGFHFAFVVCTPFFSFWPRSQVPVSTVFLSKPTYSINRTHQTETQVLPNRLKVVISICALLSITGAPTLPETRGCRGLWSAASAFASTTAAQQFSRQFQPVLDGFNAVDRFRQPS